MMEKKSISVIIPNFNGKQLLEKYLPPLYVAIESSKHILNSEIIIVDDASTDASVNFLQNSYPDIILLRNNENSGFSKTINKGVFKAGMDLVLLLNTDMLLPFDFFDFLIPHFLSSPALFGVSPTIKDEQGNICLEAQKLPAKIDGYLHYKDAYPLKPDYTFYLCGGCALIDRKKLQEINGFNEIYSPFYFEDFDLSIRAWLKGWECVYIPETGVCHCHSATVKKYFSEEYIELVFLRNRLLLNYFYLEKMDHFIFTVKHFYRYIIKKIFHPKSKFKHVFAMYLKIKGRKQQRKEILKLKKKTTLQTVLSQYFN